MQRIAGWTHQCLDDDNISFVSIANPSLKRIMLNLLILQFDQTDEKVSNSQKVSCPFFLDKAENAPLFQHYLKEML